MAPSRVWLLPGEQDKALIFRLRCNLLELAYAGAPIFTANTNIPGSSIGL
jgi:hypothetical protein